MKELILLFALIIVIEARYICPDGSVPAIEQVLRNSQRDALKLMNDLNLKTQCQKSHQLKVVCGTGYSKWNEISEVAYHKGVLRDSLDPFFNLVFKKVHFPPKDKEDLIGIFSTLKFTDGIDVFGEDIVFEREKSVGGIDNSGSYFMAYAEPNCEDEDTVDFLIYRIQGNFELSPDVFALEQCSGNIFGGECHIDYVPRAKDLSKEQLRAMRAYMQISSFVNIDKALVFMNGS